MTEQPTTLPATGSFPATPWTMVAESSGDSAEGREALARVCRLYWQPLCEFVRRSGRGAEEPEDVTQGFFQHLLSGTALEKADRTRGRLRSWLLGMMKIYMASQWRRQEAVKRGGGMERVDFAVALDQAAGTGEDALPPDLAYERRWAVTLLEKSLAALAAEQERHGRAEAFAVLGDFLSWNGGGTSYEEVATQLGWSHSAVASAIFRLRKRFRELLRTEVAATVASPDDVEEELRHLRTVFQRT